MSAPPSSVESERLFSIGGMTYTPRRSNLLPETGEKLIKLCFNLKTYNSFSASEIISPHKVADSAESASTSSSQAGELHSPAPAAV